MQAILYVFSGTGHTRIAADAVTAALRLGGYAAQVCDISRDIKTVPDPKDYDLVGFGYPIHAFNTPKLFLDFVKALPACKDKRAFIFKVSGEPFRLNCASSYALCRTLVKKGYRPVQEMHMLMPYNVMFRYPDALAKQMYRHTQAMAKLLVKRLLSGEEMRLNYPIRYRLLSYALRLEWFGAWINGPLYRANRRQCTHCGICMRICPGKNIRADETGKPHFGWKCTMCMRCVMNCPRDAVRPGILNLWRVNGPYPFQSILSDRSIADTWINADTRGYFRLFQKYYRRTYEELSRAGIDTDAAYAAPAKRKQPFSF